MMLREWEKERHFVKNAFIRIGIGNDKSWYGVESSCECLPFFEHRTFQYLSNRHRRCIQYVFTNCLLRPPQKWPKFCWGKKLPIYVIIAVASKNTGNLKQSFHLKISTHVYRCRYMRWFFTSFLGIWYKQRDKSKNSTRFFSFSTKYTTKRKRTQKKKIPTAPFHSLMHQQLAFRNWTVYF